MRIEQYPEPLVAYKEEFGHCNVPSRYAENVKLGTWVNTQRSFYNRGKLSADRINKLEAIGFEWTRRKTTKSAETNPESP